MTPEQRQELREKHRQYGSYCFAYALALGCWAFLFGVCTYGFWAHS